MTGETMADGNMADGTTPGGMTPGASAGTTPPPATLFERAQVFDGTRFLDGPQDVLVRGDRVVAVGRELADTDAAAGATRVDLRGRTLLPGFIDCHVHLMSSHVGSPQAFTDPFSAQFYASVENARTTLGLGITTAREAGGADKGLRLAIASGAIPGPRLRLAITMMSQTGGHGDMRLDSGHTLPFLEEHRGRPSGIADGAEECRRVARRILRAGADQIKIASTGGVLSPSDDPHWSQFTIDEITAIVEEAAAQDKYVMAHAIGRQGILNALRGGVRSIEHGIYLDDECLELMVERGAYLTPTLVAPLFVIWDAEKGLPVPAQTLEKAKRVTAEHREACARAIDAGVRIIFGSDAGVGPHGLNLRELALLADAGMSLEQVLAAATSTAASLLGEEDSLGVVRPGTLADLVVLDEQLTSTGQLEGLADHVVAVWQGGRQTHRKEGQR